MADGTLNFNTEMDTRSVQQGIELILQELRKISAAIQSVPEIRVEADTSQVEETRRDIDSLPDQTDIEVDVGADRTEVEATRRDLDSLPDQTDIEVDVESDRTEVVATEEAVNNLPKETDIDVKVESDSSEIVDTEEAVKKVGETAQKTADEASKAFGHASKSAGAAVNESCDSILKKLSGTLGKAKGIIVAAGLAFLTKQLKAFASESEKLYQVQFGAEIRLEQIMHNVTGATREQVEATKQMASELQKVGVIGDEVTLTGLQELGKYVNSADSIRKLSGALDDLLAQEYGLNATAESAASVSSMLGKALNGQTAILKRNGIIFTEAQENILKYGNEEERVATLARVIESRVGGMNEALAKTPAGRLKQLSNTLGDIKEQFGEAYTNVKSLLVPVLERLASVLAKVATLAVRATQALGKIFGVSLDDSISYNSNIEQSIEEQEALTDAVNDTAKAQKKSLASFDKLNTLSSGKDEGSSKASSASVAQSMPVTVETSKAEDDIDKFAKKLKTVFTRLKNWWQKNFAPIFSGIWDGLKGEAQELWGTLQRVFSDIQSLGGPLLDYFNNYFTPFLQTVFEVAGKIIVGLFDTFNTVFSDIWDIVLFPYLQTYLTVGLPMLTEFATEAVKTFGVYFDEVKKIFDMLWADVARPVLTFIMQLWQDLMLSLKAFWDKWGAPIFEKLRTAIQKASEIYQKAWNTIWKPVFDKFMSAVDELWSEHMKPLVDNVLDFVGVFIDAALDIYNGFVAPILGWFIDKFGPVISMVLGNVIEAVSKYAGSILDATSHIIDYLKGVVNFVAGVFTGDWSRAWEGIKTAFAGAWGALADIVKAPVNLIIGMINHLLDCIEYGINSTIWNLNNLSFDIPDWVPEIGGETFGFNLSMIDIPELPYLAKGTVVPANYGEFLAVLGDNKREAEVVSPLSTIKKAVAEAMAENGGAGPKEITIYTYLYPNSAAYHREIINIVNADARNRGGV